MARCVERNKRYYEQEIDAPKSILRSCADGRRNSQFWGGTEKMRHTNWRRNLIQSIQPWDASTQNHRVTFAARDSETLRIPACRVRFPTSPRTMCAQRSEHQCTPGMLLSSSTTPNSRPLGIATNVGVSGGARSEPSELSFVKCVIGGARIALKWRAIQQVQVICSLCKARPKVRHRRSLPWILRLTSKQTFVLGDPKSRRYWLELR
jgi:hypothetical protein